MTQDVDILSTRAPELSQELRDHLADRFNVAIRLRRLGAERGYRLYQVRKPRNRHLVDVRPVDALPATRSFAEDCRRSSTKRRTFPSQERPKMGPRPWNFCETAPSM